MKPSERRALEAEQRAQKEAEQREKLLEAKAKRQQSLAEHRREEEAGRINTDADYKKLPEEEIQVKGDGYHRESFFGNHVKLITFIICAVLILTVIGPWGVDRLVDKGREEIYGKEVENRIELSLEGLEKLAEMGDDLTWDSLANLSYVDYSFEKDGVMTHIREYSITGTDVVLRVGGTEVGSIYEYVIPGTSVVLFRKVDTALPEKPEYVRLIDYQSGDFVEDIRKDDMTVFLSEHTGS
ncbi:MAG: hypothetical protein IJY39_08880 [Clostridia bacterium]|nr:hypothetical protein [Clostridia bacterium]